MWWVTISDWTFGHPRYGLRHLVSRVEKHWTSSVSRESVGRGKEWSLFLGKDTFETALKSQKMLWGGRGGVILSRKQFFIGLPGWNDRQEGLQILCVINIYTDKPFDSCSIKNVVFTFIYVNNIFKFIKRQYIRQYFIHRSYLLYSIFYDGFWVVRGDWTRRRRRRRLVVPSWTRRSTRSPITTEDLSTILFSTILVTLVLNPRTSEI